MIRKLMVVTTGLILGAALAVAAETKAVKFKLEPESLKLHRKLGKDLFPNTADSVHLSFAVSHPEKYLLDIDPNKSTVSQFTDDKGTSLSGTTLFSKSIFSRTNTSKDHRAFLISVSSNGIAPARGATKVTVKGTLVLICGKDEKTTEAVPVTLKAKTEVKKGDFTIMVTREKSFGDLGATLKVTSKRAITGIVAKDADGNVIEPFFPLSPYYHPFYKRWSCEAVLKKQVKEAKISVTWFSKEEKVEVPVDVSMGVGS
jgi:hypothetical protein